jgi:hypothetical protein
VRSASTSTSSQKLKNVPLRVDLPWQKKEAKKSYPTGVTAKN